MARTVGISYPLGQVFRLSPAWFPPKRSVCSRTGFTANMLAPGEKLLRDGTMTPNAGDQENVFDVGEYQ